MWDQSDQCLDKPSYTCTSVPVHISECQKREGSFLKDQKGEGSKLRTEKLTSLMLSNVKKKLHKMTHFASTRQWTMTAEIFNTFFLTKYQQFNF